VQFCWQTKLSLAPASRVPFLHSRDIRCTRMRRAESDCDTKKLDAPKRYFPRFTALQSRCIALLVTESHRLSGTHAQFHQITGRFSGSQFGGNRVGKKNSLGEHTFGSQNR
jgi:hypothetical protein